MSRDSYQLKSKSWPERQRVFIGCEGDSERGYGRLLSDLLKEEKLPFHIDTQPFPRSGGNPLMLMRLAKERIEKQISLGKPPYIAHAVFFDIHSATKAQIIQANKIAEKENIISVWQEPCYEGLLLLHTGARTKKLPTSPAEAKHRLVKQWGHYEKGMSAMQLSKHIGLQDIIHAAKLCEGLAKLLKLFEL